MLMQVNIVFFPIFCFHLLVPCSRIYRVILEPHCRHWLRRIWQPLALVLCLSSFISCMKLSVVWWHCGWGWVLHDGLHAVVVDAAGAYSAWRPSEASKRMWRVAGEARGWLWPQKPQDWSLKFNSVWRRSIYVIDSSTNYPSRSSRHPSSTYRQT